MTNKNEERKFVKSLMAIVEANFKKIEIEVMCNELIHVACLLTFEGVDDAKEGIRFLVNSLKCGMKCAKKFIDENPKEK